MPREAKPTWLSSPDPGPADLSSLELWLQRRSSAKGHSMIEPAVDTSPKTWDEIKTTTCYMCACRCGIKVYLKDGTVKYIEGNRDHPVNKGVICGKGASGIMQHYSPARLSKPMLRVGERGSGEFREIEWEEALRT